MRVLGIAIASALLITPVMIAPVMADDGINGVVRNLDRALNPDERRQQAYYYDRGNDRRYDRDRRFEEQRERDLYYRQRQLNDERQREERNEYWRDNYYRR